MSPNTKPLQDLTGKEFGFKEVLVLGTSHSPSHQISHCDHKHVYRSEWGDNEAYIFMVPLDFHWAALRLDVLTDECHNWIDSDHLPVNEAFLFSTQAKKEQALHMNILDRYVFAMIPPGAALGTNFKQFHGGHYGSVDGRRLFIVLSTFDFDKEGNDYDFFFLRDHLPQPKTKASQVFRQAGEEVSTSIDALRLPYYDACRKIKELVRLHKSPGEVGKEKVDEEDNQEEEDDNVDNKEGEDDDDDDNFVPEGGGDGDDDDSDDEKLPIQNLKRRDTLKRKYLIDSDSDSDSATQSRKPKPTKAPKVGPVENVNSPPTGGLELAAINQSDMEHVIEIMEENLGTGFAKFYQGCPPPPKLQQDPTHPCLPRS